MKHGQLKKNPFGHRPQIHIDPATRPVISQFLKRPPQAAQLYFQLHLQIHVILPNIIPEHVTVKTAGRADGYRHTIRLLQRLRLHQPLR